MESTFERTTTGPKDVFLHLLSILGLYVSAGSFVMLTFTLINIYIPDPLSSGNIFYTTNNALLRFPLSVLVVVFPLYVWLTYYLQKDVLEHPEKKELKTRKWLTYFTIAAAGVLAAGTLVGVVNRFLGGELTARFSLKVLTLFVVSLAVFGYYLWNLRSSILASRHPIMRLFVGGVILVVLAVLVLGFASAGSPTSERQHRFDRERVNDLQTIQFHIIDYRERTGMLPASLDVLENELLGYRVPNDPQTGDSYTYRTDGKLSFILCATFAADPSPLERAGDQPSLAPRGRINENWAYRKGETCFDRTIDPELFPLRKTQ